MDNWRANWRSERKTALVFLAAFRGFALAVAISLSMAGSYFDALTPAGWIAVGTAVAIAVNADVALGAGVAIRLAVGVGLAAGAHTVRTSGMREITNFSRFTSPPCPAQALLG